MTYEQISTMISSIGLPYAYYSFPEEQAPTLPYIVFYYPDYDDLGADNINYQTIANLNIELYTSNKDFTKEASVETVLTNAWLYFQKSETFITSEQMYEVLYQIQLVITKGN